jgi:hypothetical protein
VGHLGWEIGGTAPDSIAVAGMDQGDLDGNIARHISAQAKDPKLAENKDLATERANGLLILSP